MNAMLVIIDMQAGPLDRKELFKPDTLVTNINLLIGWFRWRRLPILFFRHTNHSNLVQNSDGWQVSKRLRLLPEDTVLNKKQGSIFNEDQFLRSLEQLEISHLFVCGLVTNESVQATCLDALERGLTVILPEDGHSTWGKNAQAVINQWNRDLAVKGVQVITTSECIKNGTGIL